MALFGPSKEQKAAAENQVMQLLAGQEYLARLMDELLIKAGKKEVEIDGEVGYISGNEWLTKCQSYYDSRQRKVVIEPDGFIIKWAGSHTEQYQGADGHVHSQTVEDVYEQIGYAYTNDGYRPLHGVNVGEVTVTQDRVVALWAKVIRERMVSLFPELKISGDFYSSGDTTTFSYYVPEESWKDWF